MTFQFVDQDEALGVEDSNTEVNLPEEEKEEETPEKEETEI